MKVKTTVHYEHLEESDKRITVEQGGTRSAKTYNILIWFIIRLLNEQGKTWTVVRKTLPSVKKSVFRDFTEILESMELFDPGCLNKTEMTYNLRGNEVQFIGVDQAQKIRGTKRNYLFINEANELTYEEFHQLIIRTTQKAVLDYNPSDEYHWIYDRVIPRDDADFYQTTYRDNPYLEDVLVKEIEHLKNVDDNYWRVYGLGERGFSKATIFNKWHLIDDIDDCPGKETVYGCDLGFNDPTAIIEIKQYDRNVYLNERLYKSYLTVADIIRELKGIIHKPMAEIWVDNSRPEVIEEMKRAGLNAKPSIKGKNSVKDGIDYLKQKVLYVTKGSINLLKEMKMYKWKEDGEGRVLDEPVDLFNHAIDATRYGVAPKRVQTNTTKAMLGIK